MEVSVIQRLCVFCGSQSGNNPRFAEDARALGTLLAQAQIQLVFGGGKIGLMGEVADAALAAGGEVIGVMPRLLVERERAHLGLTELITVESMAERKQLMADRSDAFLAMPGGLGTLDELFEMMTWNQIGLHLKPCFVLNTDGYYNSLLEFIEKGLHDGLIYPLGSEFQSSETPAGVLELLQIAASRGQT
jgi:uncharacterized protein (TIGR00730 family)